MGLSELSFSATNINVGKDADKPINPKAGDLYVATDTNIIYVCYVDGEWVSTTNPKSGADVDKPSSPKAGDLYIANDTKRMLVCFYDGVWTELLHLGNFAASGVIGYSRVDPTPVIDFESGTDIYHAHDAEVRIPTSENWAYARRKTITLGFCPSSVLRVYWEMKSATSQTTVWGRIYVNGRPVSREWSTSNIGYTIFIETISGLSAGDTLELWTARAGELNDVFVRKFRILCKTARLENS